MSGRQRSVRVEARDTSRGKTYKLRWFYGSPQTVTVFSRPEAKSAVLAIEALGCNIAARDERVSTGSLWNEEARESAHGGMTYEEAAELTISANVKAGEKTLAEYRREATTSYRSGRFRGRTLASITEDELLGWISEMRRERVNGKPLDDATIANRTVFCRSVFRRAFRKGWIKRNPWEEIPKSGDPLEPTRVRSHEHKLTPTEVARIVAFSDNARHALLWHVLAYTGLRIGEALALTVGNVKLDGERGRIIVRHGLNHATGELTEPKTRRSRREVTLDPETVRRLRPFVDGRKPGEFVFQTPVTGKPLNYVTVRRGWVRALELAGVDPSTRIHDLRHTHASWLMNDGAPVLAVSARLGHASVRITTEVYGHVDPHGEAAIMESIARRGETAAAVTPIKGRRRATS